MEGLVGIAPLLSQAVLLGIVKRELRDGSHASARTATLVRVGGAGYELLHGKVVKLPSGEGKVRLEGLGSGKRPARPGSREEGGDQEAIRDMPARDQGRRSLRAWLTRTAPGSLQQ